MVLLQLVGGNTTDRRFILLVEMGFFDVDTFKKQIVYQAFLREDRFKYW